MNADGIEIMQINIPTPNFVSSQSGFLGLKSANINVEGDVVPPWNFLNQLVENAIIPAPIYSIWVNSDQT